MPKLIKIIHQSISVASHQPTWWLFALLQAIIFSAVGQLTIPGMLEKPFGPVIILATVLLAPITIWLWQNIAVEVKVLPRITVGRNFINQNLSGTWLVVCTAMVIILVRLMLPLWPVHTFVFAVVASSSGLALLYIALCGNTLASSFRLVLYTWNRRISIVAAAAFVLLVAHGISFALVHGILDNVYSFREFSVFGLSATIWVMLIALTAVIAYFSAILNCFVVLLFLDSIARKKDPEEQKAKVMELAMAGKI